MTEALLFLFTGCIGLLATVIMLTSYKRNPVFNVFLMLIFITTSARSLIHGSHLLGLQSTVTAENHSILYLLIIPSFYLYYKNLINQEKSFQIKDMTHYVFILSYYLAHAIPAIGNSSLFYYDIVDFAIITVFSLFYFWIILKLLTTQLWNKKERLINLTHYNLIKNWTLFLATSNIVAVSFLLISMYLEFSKDGITGKNMSIFVVLCWLFIYFKILISPEILFGLPVLNKKPHLFNTSIAKVNGPAIKTTDSWKSSLQTPKNNRDLRLEENIKHNILVYTNEVDQLNYTVGIFRNSKTSLNDIANEMGVPISHLMYLFKYHSKISFSDYRMHGRIQDAINLIENDFLKTNTLETLSFKVGFSSYSPFFRAFQKIIKLSPQEYISKNRKIYTPKM